MTAVNLLLIRYAGNSTVWYWFGISHESGEVYYHILDAEVGLLVYFEVNLLIFSRSGKGKATKNSNEAEYRLIFDNLIDDLLVVLFWPEWPAAGLILSIASKFMVRIMGTLRSIILTIGEYHRFHR